MLESPGALRMKANEGTFFSEKEEGKKSKDGKKGRREEGKKGGREEGRKAGRQEGRKVGRHEWKKAGRHEWKKAGKIEGRKAGSNHRWRKKWVEEKAGGEQWDWRRLQATRSENHKRGGRKSSVLFLHSWLKRHLSMKRTVSISVTHERPNEKTARGHSRFFLFSDHDKSTKPRRRKGRTGRGREGRKGRRKKRQKRRNRVKRKQKRRKARKKQGEMFGNDALPADSKSTDWAKRQFFLSIAGTDRQKHGCLSARRAAEVCKESRQLRLHRLIRQTKPWVWSSS